MKLTFIFLSLLFLGTIYGQEDGLYAPAPMNDTAYEELSFAQVSPYRVVPQGARTLVAGDVSQEIEVQAGKFYSLAITPGGVVVLEDASSSNRAKALLLLYNFSDIPTIDLKTADGKTEVFSGVAPGTETSVEVNGITVDLAVSSEGKVLQEFPGVQLERGAAYSAFVLGTASAPTVIWVQSETTTE
jgi:alginate O-acetyltransferase complex protein AlgF